jgi:hypothetical protein
MLTAIDPRMNTRLTLEQINFLLRSKPMRVAEGGGVLSGAVRLSYPSLAKRAKNLRDPNAEGKYQAAGLFPTTNIGPLAELCKSTARAAYPSVTDPSMFMDKYSKNSPIKDQSLKVNVADGGREPMKGTSDGYVVGLPFFNAKSGRQVPCFKAVAGRWVPILPEELEKEMYGGAWVEAKLVCFKSTTSANPGVALGLQGLWKLADDNFLGGGGGASADEGGEAVALGVEDPNQIMQSTAAAGGSDGWG